MAPEPIFDRLPLFPLPNLVLLPRQLLPLHIFEPRYRAMLAHALQHEGLIGMGTLQGQSVHSILGIGKVVAHQPQLDGRSDILLEHVATADLTEELETEHPFRVVQARTRPEEPPTDAIETVRNLILQLASPDADPTSLQALLEQPPIELVHRVAAQLFSDPRERLAYLEAATPRRLQLVESSLLGVLAKQGPIADA